MLFQGTTHNPQLILKFQLTCVFLLSQLATWRWWILKAAYPLVLHLENTSCDAGVVLIVVAPEDVVRGKLINYILHNLRRDL